MYVRLYIYVYFPLGINIPYREVYIDILCIAFQISILFVGLSILDKMQGGD